MTELTEIERVPPEEQLEWENVWKVGACEVSRSRQADRFGWWYLAQERIEGKRWALRTFVLDESGERGHVQGVLRLVDAFQRELGRRDSPCTTGPRSP